MTKAFDGFPGYRAERQSDDFEVEKRRTYRPWNTFLSEKASLLSEIYRGSNQLKLVSIVSSISILPNKQPMDTV